MGAVQNMHTLFDIVQDKYNAPFFIQEEKDVLLNNGQIIFLNGVIYGNLLKKKQPKKIDIDHDVEDIIASSEIIRPLITADSAKTPSAGKIAISSIVGFMHLLSIVRASDRLPVRFARYNDIGKFYQNSFKAPSTNKLYYTIDKDSIIIHPTSTSSQMLISYIQEPTEISYPVDVCDLPEYTHIYIVAHAIELAGIATYDDALTAISEIV